jgi:hypothetical protein
MKLSARQRAAVEKVTGKPWHVWHPEALRVYFAYTDKGQHLRASPAAAPELEELLSLHRQHAAIVEMWKADFRAGLLFPTDFQDSPPSHLKHALEIYCAVMVHVPEVFHPLFKQAGVPCDSGGYV